MQTLNQLTKILDSQKDVSHFNVVLMLDKLATELVESKAVTFGPDVTIDKEFLEESIKQVESVVREHPEHKHVVSLYGRYKEFSDDDAVNYTVPRHNTAISVSRYKNNIITRFYSDSFETCFDFMDVDYTRDEDMVHLLLTVECIKTFFV